VTNKAKVFFFCTLWFSFS